MRLRARPATIARAAALVAAATVATLPRPVEATPGQTLAAFLAWSAARPQLRGIARSNDEMATRPVYELTTADHGVAWHFRARLSWKHVESETLALASGPGEPGATPISHDGTGYGFQFFRTLYGDAVARDFLAAKSVGVVTDSQSRVATTFYRGSRFGYETAAGFVTIATLPVLARDLAQLRFCVAHPDRCSE